MKEAQEAPSEHATHARTHTRLHMGVRSKWEGSWEPGEQIQGQAWFSEGVVLQEALSHIPLLPHHGPLREPGAVIQSVLAPAPGQLPLGTWPPPTLPAPGPPFLTWSDSSKHRQRVVGESHAWGAALRGEGTAEVQLS